MNRRLRLILQPPSFILLLALTCVPGTRTFGQPEPPPADERPAPMDDRGPEREGRRGPGGPEEMREGRVMREVVRLKLWLKRLRAWDTQIAKAKEKLAEPNAEPTPQQLTPREIELRSELFEIDRQRFVASAKMLGKKFTERFAAMEAKAEGKPEAENNERSERLAERLAEVRAFSDGVAKDGVTFDEVAALLDAIGPNQGDAAQDAALQRRLSRLDEEADSLRERLRAIEEEIGLIRGDTPGEFPPGPPPGAFPPPSDEMRERGMFDGRRMPPNHPSNRRGRERGGPEPGAPRNEKAEPKPTP